MHHRSGVRTPIIRLHGVPSAVLSCSRGVRGQTQSKHGNSTSPLDVEFLTVPETRVDTPPPGRRWPARRSSSVPSRDRKPSPLPGPSARVAPNKLPTSTSTSLTDPELVMHSSRHLSTQRTATDSHNPLSDIQGLVSGRANLNQTKGAGAMTSLCHPRSVSPFLDGPMPSRRRQSITDQTSITLSGETTTPANTNRVPPRKSSNDLPGLDPPEHRWVRVIRFIHQDQVGLLLYFFNRLMSELLRHFPDPLINGYRNSESSVAKQNATHRTAVDATDRTRNKRPRYPLKSLSSEEEELQEIWSTPLRQIKLQGTDTSRSTGELLMHSSGTVISEDSADASGQKEVRSFPDTADDQSSSFSNHNSGPEPSSDPDTPVMQNGQLHLVTATNQSLQDIRRLDRGSSSSSIESDEFPLDAKPPSYSSDSIEVSPITSTNKIV